MRYSVRSVGWAWSMWHHWALGISKDPRRRNGLIEINLHYVTWLGRTKRISREAGSTQWIIKEPEKISQTSVGDPWHFWCGSGSAGPYLSLTNPDPTPDLTPFFSDFKEKHFSSYFFSYNLPAGTLSSVYCFKDIVCQILFCKRYFSPLNTFMRKGKNPDPEPDPYLVPTSD